MTLDQLIGQYARLRQELLDARADPRRQLERIERLADELLATERAIAMLQAGDEQTSEQMPSFTITR